jgi:hypothetical protein
MLKTTKHAETRMQHRGIRPSDLTFLETHATLVDEGYILTNRDVQDIETEAKRLVAKAHRLKGTFMAVADDHIITVYKAFRKGKSHRLLHR